jgi:hypothetical protein
LQGGQTVEGFGPLRGLAVVVVVWCFLLVAAVVVVVVVVWESW